MEMPKPTENHKKLEKLVGSWSGTDKVYPSPWTPEASKQATCRCSMALDGMFLFMDYEQRTDGKVTFAGHGVIGYDAAGSRYCMHWFDNFGSPPLVPGFGQWAGDTLTFDFKHPDHKGRTVYELKAGALIQRVEMDVDGNGFKPIIEGTYKRA